MITQSFRHSLDIFSKLMYDILKHKFRAFLSSVGLLSACAYIPLKLYPYYYNLQNVIIDTDTETHEQNKKTSSILERTDIILRAASRRSVLFILYLLL